MKNGVKNGEGCSVQETDIGIGDPQIGFDILGEDRQNLSDDKIEDIDQHQHKEYVLGISAADIRLIRCWFLIRRRISCGLYLCHAFPFILIFLSQSMILPEIGMAPVYCLKYNDLHYLGIVLALSWK